MYGQRKAKNAEEYIKGLEEPRKSEIRTLHELIVKTAPKLASYVESGLLGYGRYHYKYASGREGDSALIGLASNKNYISFYASAVKDGRFIADYYKDRLGKASCGKSCIRIRKIEDIDLSVLKELIKETENLNGFGEE